jgi:translation elongation factor EF-1alpha
VAAFPSVSLTADDGRVSIDPNEQDFVLTITQVVTLAGHGTAVIGPATSGVLCAGDEVEV